MPKKLGKRGFAVLTSLALCASLVLPSFAASFSDLNNAINGSYTGTAFDIADGKITLKENVEARKDGTDSIDVEGRTVTIDLNGWDIIANGHTSSSAIWVRNNANLTLEDSKGEDGESGKITGAAKSAVWVGKDSTFTMKGGEISGNHAKNAGAAGGVTVVNGGTFNMEGGVIKDNTSEHQAANVLVSGEGNDGNGATQLVVSGGEIAGGNKSVEVRGNTEDENKNAQLVMKDQAVVSGKIYASNGAVISAEGGADKDGKIFNGFVVKNEKDEKLSPVEKGKSYTADQASYLEADYVERETSSEPTTPVTPTIPVTPATPDEPVIDLEEEVIDIDDPAVPLAAGPVTRGEFIDYLWRHENQPEAAAPTYADVPADHEYASAIGWAQSIGILERVVFENSFDPDELVTVAAVRDILIEFAEYAGMEMPELTTLMGEDDEAVLNCDEILAEFFGEEPAE